MIVGFKGAGIKLPRRADWSRQSGGAVLARLHQRLSIDTLVKARLLLQKISSMISIKRLAYRTGY